MLNILEHEVIPLYFSRNGDGEREAWIEKSKASMRSILPHFNGMRMATDYLRDFYGPAARQGKLLADNGAVCATQMARWRSKIAEAWPLVRVRLADSPRVAVNTGEPMPVDVMVSLNGLSPEDVEVECVIGQENDFGEFVPVNSLRLEPVTAHSTGETLYRVDLCSPWPCYMFEGLQHYKIRIYPFHKLLSHRFECGLMLWL